MTVSSKELIERMHAQFPLALELADPITGAPFQVNRDNVLALLAIDVDNLVLESQTAAMLYGEMARLHAAAKLQRDQTDVEFRKWRSGKAAWARKHLSAGETSKGQTKAPTKDQIEEHYRNDPDYESEYAKTNRAAVIVDLFADLKEAFRLKQRALSDLHGVTFGHDRVQSADDRMREMEARSEAFALPMMESSSYELDEIRRGRQAPAENEGGTPPKSTKTAKTARAPKRPAKGADK